ncbi:MAG: Ig-like domain-containing protein [Clostridia bacterium]|nr:Ig-like domain-containing protein [Clostridia bacterium]
MKKKLTKISLLLIAVLLIVLSATAVLVSAEDSIELKGDMEAITAAFDEKYLVQSTVRGEDKYVGDYQYTMYYDKEKGPITVDYNGTPIIIYTVNHPKIERVGTDEDVEIIQSMLNNGYVVVVLDYLESDKAVSPAIDYSTQLFRANLVYGWGEIFTNKTLFPEGNYRENFLVPSGCNVLLNQVFWETDKHSVNGTFNKIVENWNSDFRATKGNNLVRWMHTDGTRKAVQNDFDGNEPLWYNANGKVDANGEYTYIKFTKAEVVTDCINPDGTPLNMDLHMHIVYHTNPENPVPVMALANSSGYLTTCMTNEDDLRPHSNGFLYAGYSTAVYDHLWEPMGENTSWGYYDGAKGVSKDHMNYSLNIYNDKLVNTAAMRFLRYTSLSGGDTYNFNTEKIGVYGNSKGGWFNFLGEAIIQTPLVKNTDAYTSIDELEDAISFELEKLPADRMYDGHHGETRYSVGAEAVSGDGVTFAAGEKQPWLTYNGKEIISGCQVTIPENGGSEEDITEGHMPIFVTSNLADYLDAHYGVTLRIYNVCRELNLPLLHFELPIGHTLPSGQDINHNVDSYDALMKFVNYYLKNAPINVAYVTPMNNAGKVRVTDKITVAFTGQAELEDVQKITVTAGEDTVSGSWEKSFGGVVWTFTPDALSGNTKYTLTVPAGFSGTNNQPTKTVYEASFITEFDVAAEPTSVSENVYTFTAPSFTSGNSFVFRFNVTNDAANVAELYENDANGDLLGSVNLRGAGSYEIDITDYVAANSGKDITLLLKGKNSAGSVPLDNDTLTGETLSEDISVNTTNSTVITASSINGVTALEAKVTKPYNYNYSKYYNNPTRILKYNNVTQNLFSKDDLGRLYTFSIDVYDTVDRVFQIRLRNMTDETNHETIDYDWVFRTYKTTANQWSTYTFTYRVYESDYGIISQNKNQYLELFVAPDGDLASSIYFKNLVISEVITDIDVSGAAIAEKQTLGGAYTPAVSASPFAIYNGETLIDEYDSFTAALAAYTSGYSLKLQSDYTFTDSDVSDQLKSFTEFNFDLGSYTLTLDNTKNSPLWIKATNKNKLQLNLSGGVILVGDTPIISYESSISAGSGKSVELNLDGVKIGLADNSGAINILSGVTLPAGLKLDAHVSLTNCELDLPDDRRARDAATILPTSSTAGLDLSYTVKGGSIYLTSERWISILNNVSDAEFLADTNGNYTKLLLPSSYTYELKCSCFTDRGYASYSKQSEESNITTYNLTIPENSTKYGIIPESIASDSSYVFILFKDGSYVSAHKNLKSVTQAAEKLMASAGEDEVAEILLTQNHKATNSGASDVAYGTARGTIVFDLDGHTLTRGGNALAAGEINSSTTTYYKTSIVFKNGRIETAKGLMFVTHYRFSTSGVKTYDFTFDNVTFGYAEGATSLNNAFWNVWSNSHFATISKTNITLRNCTFDFKTNSPTSVSATTLFKFNEKGERADINLVIEGGEILGNGANITFANPDAYDTLTLAPNENGEYIKFIPSSDSATAPNLDNFSFADGKKRSFALEGGEYVMKEETVYGEIPAEYPASTHPFVILVYNSETGKYEFNQLTVTVNNESKTIIPAYDTWKAVTTDIQYYANDPSSDVVLLVREDYTNTNDGCADGTSFHSVGGKLTVDLGGHTFTRGGKTVFSFAAFNTSFNDASGQIIIKNGKLLSDGGAIFVGHKNAKLTEGSTKTWNITLEDVTLGFADGATKGDYMFWVEWSSSTQNNTTVQFNVTLNNCTLDLKTNNPGSTPTLFHLKKTSASVYTHDFEIKGGTIISDNLAGIKLFNKESSDTITYTKNSNGEYVKLISTTTEKDASHYNGSLSTDEGDKYFVEVSDDGVNSVYELKSLATDYGTASNTAKYLSELDYPFFIFQGGEFVTAAESWAKAMSEAVKLVDEESESELSVEIVMRRDYDVYKAVDAANGRVTFNKARGKVIFDLCGYTITTVDGYLIDVYINNSASSVLGFKSHLTVRNGTILNLRKKLCSIAFGHEGESPDGQKKNLSFTFENVTFKATEYSVIRDWGHSYKTGLKLDFVFDGCTYDFSDSVKGLTMLYFESNQTSVNTDAEFIGGKIIASNANNYTVVNYGADDSIRFTKDSDGNHITIVQPTKNTAPTFTLKNEKGKDITITTLGTEGYYTVYVFKDPVETAYGDIPFDYSNEETYPFVVFGEDGSFIGAYATLLGTGAMDAAKTYLTKNVWNGTSYGASEKSAVILMRRNYTMQSSDTYSDYSYIEGSVTLDLGMLTLTSRSDDYMFSAKAKSCPTDVSGDSFELFPSVFTVKNGNLVSVDKSILSLGTDGADADISGKNMFWQFENVTFSNTGTAQNPIIDCYHSSTSAVVPINVSFDDCVFDLSNITQTTRQVFNIYTGTDVQLNITVSGGEIIAPEDITLLDVLYYSSSTGSDIEFTQNENGFIKIITDSVYSNSEELNTSLGNASFVKTSSSDGTNVYSLVPTSLTKFTPKMSITLDRNLVMNVYIPAEALVKFTFNGQNYENLDEIAKNKTTIDGNEYYLMKAELPAAEAASTVKLIATVSAGGISANATFSFSIPKYAEKVIAGSNETEIKLVKDVLLYVKSAYVYFGTNDPEAIAKINTLLGDYTAKPIVEGSSEKPTAALASVAFVLKGTPSMRFYLADGRDASEYKFYIDTKEVKTKVSDDGTYVDIDVYAYALCETVTYTVGEESGSFHINAYYSYVSGAEYTEADKTELISLTECFWNYLQSARAYRSSVTEG